MLVLSSSQFDPEQTSRRDDKARLHDCSRLVVRVIWPGAARFAFMGGE
jgi:hypothetical protein